MAEKKKDMEFEAAMKRIDEISVKLEDSGLTLDDSLALYEEGVRLVRVCSERLENAQRRVSVLKTNPDGEIQEADFLSADGEGV